VDELKQAASDGPIILVSVTDIGSDVIIVTKGKIKALSLPDFQYDTAPPSAQQHFNFYSSSRSEGAERPMDPEDEPMVTQKVSLDQLSWLWCRTCRGGNGQDGNFVVPCSTQSLAQGLRLHFLSMLLGQTQRIRPRMLLI
jgi:hypothetical protein